LQYVSRHLRQYVCTHGSTRGSVYTSVQIGHSVVVQLLRCRHSLTACNRIIEKGILRERES